MFGGFDLGKMLSGEGGGGLGGMFGGSIMNMVKSQLASTKNIEMLNRKVIEMAEMLCQKFNDENSKNEDIIKEKESIKEAANKRVAEIQAEFNAKSEEDKAASRENTQLMINEVFKEANKKLNDIIITIYDITLAGKMKNVSSKNEKGELMLVPSSDNSGTMVELRKDALFIEIYAKGIIKQELRAEELLANMMTESPGEG